MAAITGAVVGVASMANTAIQSKKSRKAAKGAAQTQAAAQTEALDYLKETEALPQEIREEALTGLRGYYQVPGAPKSQEELITQAKSSPLYGAIMGSREAGEESILRNASATGRLRGGGTMANLSDYNMQLENQALLQGFNQAQSRDDYERSMNLSGLSGLANLPSNTNAIAGMTAGIGQTLAQGQTASAQAQQQGNQNMMGNLMGIGQLGLQAYSAGLFSDIRLKENIEFVEVRGNLPWFTWDWNKDAAKYGLSGKDSGVMAHHVLSVQPEALIERDGYLTVAYDLLDLEEAA